MHTKQSLKTLFLATLFVASSWSAGAAEIELRGDAAVSGPIVRLGDIARVRHEQPEVVAEWESLGLFPAPAAGKTRLVKRQEVAQLLSFIDEQLGKCHVVGSPVVNVRAADAEPEVASSVVPVAYQAKKPADPPSPPQLQTAKTVSQIPVAATANVAGNQPISTGENVAVVAIRRVDRGDRIRREDVEIRTVSAEMPVGSLVRDIEAVIGKEATQAINPTAPISADMVQAPRLVRRGETVNVRAVAAGIRVTTSGRAMEDGSEGQVVQVELADTRERIAARVTGVQLVEVYAGGARIASPGVQQPLSQRK